MLILDSKTTFIHSLDSFLCMCACEYILDEVGTEGYLAVSKDMHRMLSRSFILYSDASAGQ